MHRARGRARPLATSGWHRQSGEGPEQYGFPLALTDGKSVFVMFGTGKLAAFDFSGRQLWTRDLATEYGKFSINWLYGSSPMLYQEKLYVEVIQANPIPPDYLQAIDDKPNRESYLLCLDTMSGKNLWRHVRATDAISEAQEAYTTPIPHPSPDGLEIIVVGGNYVTAHDARTGVELWRCAGLNDRGERFWRIVPSPVAAAGMIIACGPKRDPVLGIKAGGRGLVTSTHLTWKFKEFPPDCTTPLFYQNKLFLLDGDRQMMTCLEPATGEKKWQGNLGVREIFRASPTGADGKIYCLGENGTVIVLAAGDEFRVLATIPMGEAPVRSSIAVAQRELFIRTAKNVYCIGNAPN